jgi:hypothetical protein
MLEVSAAGAGPDFTILRLCVTGALDRKLTIAVTEGWVDGRFLVFVMWSALMDDNVLIGGVPFRYPIQGDIF